MLVTSPARLGNGNIVKLRSPSTNKLVCATSVVTFTLLPHEDLQRYQRNCIGLINIYGVQTCFPRGLGDNRPFF